MHIAMQIHWCTDRAGCAAMWPIGASINNINFVLNKFAYNSGCKVDLKSTVIIDA